MNLDAKKLLTAGAQFFVFLVLVFLVDLSHGAHYRDFMRYGANYLLNADLAEGQGPYRWEEMTGRKGPFVTLKKVEEGAGLQAIHRNFSGWKYNYYTNIYKKTGRTSYSLSVNSIKGMYGSLVLLPALILCTPTYWWRRLLLLAAGMTILTILNLWVVATYGRVRGFYDLWLPGVLAAKPWWVELARGSWKFIAICFGYHAWFLSVVLWLLLCFGYWFPRDPEQVAAEHRALLAGRRAAREQRLEQESARRVAKQAPVPAASSPATLAAAAPVVNVPLAPAVKAPAVKVPAPTVKAPAVKVPAPAVKAPAVKPRGKPTGKVVERNARCPCGSGRKYKNCCGS